MTCRQGAPSRHFELRFRGFSTIQFKSICASASKSDHVHTTGHLVDHIIPCGYIEQKITWNSNSGIPDLDALEISVITKLILFQGLELSSAAVPFSRLSQAIGNAETEIKSFQVQRFKYLSHGNSLTKKVQKLYIKTGIASKISHIKLCINVNTQCQSKNSCFNTFGSTVSQMTWVHHPPSESLVFRDPFLNYQLTRQETIGFTHSSLRFSRTGKSEVPISTHCQSWKLRLCSQ